MTFIGLSDGGALMELAVMMDKTSTKKMDDGRSSGTRTD
jgi:hypothetical protein